jgi:PAS domain S-box-containing protein
VSQGTPKVTSVQAIQVFGGLTAVLLLAILVAGISENHRAKVDAARHRAGELALNAAQIVQGTLRSGANAILTFAVESRRLHPVAPQRADTLLQDIVAGIRQRQPQWQDIVVVPTTPTRAASATNDSGPSNWVGCSSSEAITITPLCFGPIERRALGEVLPLAARLDDHQWVVGYLNAATLAEALRRLRLDKGDALTITDGRGVTVAGEGPIATAASRTTSTGASWVGNRWSHDGSAFIEATAPVASYPFTVRVRIPLEEVLAPWHQQMVIAALFYLLYLSAFVCVLRMISRASHVQRHYLTLLRKSEDDLRLTQQAGRTAIWSLSDHAQRFQCSDDVGEIFGLPPGKTTATAEEFFAAVFPSDKLPLTERVGIAWKNGSPLHVEFRIWNPEGSLRWLSANGEVVLDETGNKRMAGTVVDVTEQWEARQREEQSERRFAVLFEQSPLPFWVFDVATLRFLEVNAAAVQSYGYTHDEFLAMTILDIRDPEDRDQVVADVAARAEGAPSPRVWMHRRKDGSAIEVRIHSADIVFDGRPARLALAEDVTARLAGERELAYRASHDMVTGLPNQHALLEWMDVLIASKTPFEVAFLQLLGMDAIADTFGIKVSANILRTVSSRLARLTQDNGFLATVTHEALVLAVASGQIAEAKLQAIVECVTEPLHYKDTQHQLSIVIGIADQPHDSVESDVLLRRAALAAHAHLHSDQPVHRFVPALAHASRERLHFAAKVRKAVKHHEFELHFQVITNLADQRPIGLEALIRWPQDDGTFIPPASFIPMCEEAGLIIPLGRWILTQAGKAGRELRDAGFDDLNIGINVSAAELRSGDLVASVRATRDTFALPDNALHIELTESSLIDHRETAIAVMKQLRAIGVAIALDDFGTGFSSLSYLLDLPIDTLKIDQAFVRNVDRETRSAAICDAIIALGKSLKVNIVAEGVERALQYNWLRTHGCDRAQGYYLGKPERLSVLLAQWSATAERRHVR